MSDGFGVDFSLCLCSTALFFMHYKVTAFIIALGKNYDTYSLLLLLCCCWVESKAAKMRAHRPSKVLIVSHDLDSKMFGRFKNIVIGIAMWKCVCVCVSVAKQRKYTWLWQAINGKLGITWIWNYKTKWTLKAHRTPIQSGWHRTYIEPHTNSQSIYIVRLFVHVSYLLNRTYL